MDDNGRMTPDEFFMEVIGVCRPLNLSIDFDHTNPSLDHRVHIDFESDRSDSSAVQVSGSGRTLGFALQAVREAVRGVYGQ